MKLFVPLLVSLSSAETDCNKVRRYLYPDEGDCPKEMKCSEEFACAVDKDDCDLYQCVSATGCPPGTTYSVFNPQASADDGADHEINGLEGYYCNPEGALTCSYDTDGNFYIDVVVDNKKPWIGAPQDDDEKRKVTLISKTKHDQHVEGTAFKQFHDSECVGEEIEDGTKVHFRKSANDPNCKDEFDFGHVYSEINGFTYVVDFFIGFDDYWHINEFGEERILKGGVSNQFQCRLKASDHGWVDPNPSSNRTYNYVEYNGQIPFTFKAYVDRDFSEEYDGSVIELGDEYENDGIFVEAKHGAGDGLEEHIMHLRECTSHNYLKIGENDDGTPIFEDTPSGTFAFLNDGCMDNNIVTYSQKNDRTEWTNDVKTFVKDQFKLQVDAAAGGNGAKITYSCEMVLCPLDIFKGSTSPGEPCHLNTKCSNRYDNLFSARHARTSPAKNDDVLIKTVYDEGVIITNSAEIGNFALGLAIASLLLLAL